MVVNGILDIGPYDQLTQSLLGNRFDQCREGHEVYEEVHVEDKYVPLRSMSSKTIWADDRTLLKCSKREGGDENEGNNDGDQSCDQDTDGQQEELKSTIIFIYLN